uniref:c-type cytochrome biogenensis protein n=1 Tax=Goniotrichopsis reniformis TaxID=468933 RepID=UPI001FCD8EB0|nr:c-type cytochrome biogenensis protein [Goniotrichopsis reniformis]UNJ14802.1 c-type cytochrome biogenensis protein [Goniotrichopsis reniformis]
MRQSISILSNLKLAIFLLLIIAFSSSLGTIIEQNKILDFYIQSYPESNILFNWKIIKFFQLNQVFQSWWYFCLIFILGASLITCTVQTQYPILRVSRKYIFFTSEGQFRKQIYQKEIPKEAFNHILKNLLDTRYYLFLKKNSVYAYKGLMSKIAPILIHFSLLFLILGTTASALTGYIAQEMVVPGEIFHIQNINTFGRLSYLPQQFLARVNNFRITYNKNNSIDQFYSDISIINPSYNEEKRQTISVNYPLRHNNTTIYQTDWNIIAIKCKLDNKLSIQIPLKQITSRDKQTFWIGTLKDNNLTFVSFVIQDLNDSNILLYDANGNFIQTTKIETAFALGNHKIQILDIIKATGLQIKQDPGLNLVYLGFFCLIISVLINIFQYTQIWLLQTRSSVLIAGKNNKNPLQINQTLLLLLQEFYQHSNLKN